MIIFSGVGIIIAVIMGAGFFLGQQCTGGFDDGAAKHLATWGASMGFAIAAVLNYGLCRLNLGPREKILIDKETGKEVILRPSHSLFFIPLRFWPWICLTLSIWWLILGLMQRAKGL